jgi:lysophospholipase L1-like esterase
MKKYNFKSHLKLTASILLTIGLFACDNSSSNNKGVTGQTTSPLAIQNANPGTGHIAIVGDSLAAGYRATMDQVKPAGCVKQLPHDQIFDGAIPGLTSEQILKTMATIQNEKPKLIFISSAGNDTMRDHSTPGTYPEAKTLSEMTRIFDIAINTGAVVAYLGLNPPVPYAARLPQVSALATSKGIIVVDGMNGFWTDTSLMADEIHPNDAGYGIMCNRIIQAISSYYP